ncbi:MAG: elongation factor 3 [Hyphomicrobiales bacterium]|nr:MAG: elongation factor 3 [Hyphomicrobiales bacterium]
MPPPILFLKDIHLTFGGTPLLEGTDISIEAGDRIGLVGRNGSGKSTLMKILSGEVEADKGERFAQPGTTIRYLPQEPDLSAYANVLEYVEEGLEAGDDPYRAAYLLGELGMSGQELPGEISGGEARRAALARALAPEPDVLLLDEPTNHLDLPAIEWLEDELKRCRSALVIISHDRSFLENLTRMTVWMDRGKSRTMKRGFGHFEEWRDEVLEQEELDNHKLDRKIVREEHWIVHGVSGRRKRNMRRVKELAQLRQDRKNIRKVQSGVNMTLADADKSGKLVAKIVGISKSFGDAHVVKDFSTLIQRGDRIGIVGPNGAGKTTLINLITGKIEPDSGTVKLGTNLDLLLVDQKREALNPEWSLKQALTDGAGDMVSIGQTTKHVISYMKDFLFSPEQINTPIRALSGGERGRLMLARGLRTPSNLLVLDEPTNDLDLETLDLLQEFLADYPGTVLLVSHDRDFLDRVCTSIIASDGDGQWTEYAGGYSDMVFQKGSGVQKNLREVSGEKQAKTKSGGTKSSVSSKLSGKQRHALESLPKEMERLEFEIEKLKKALEAPGLFSKEPKKFQKYADALAEREVSLAQKEEKWLKLEMIRERMEGA